MSVYNAIKAAIECPYFCRLGDKSVICEGVTRKGHVSTAFRSRSERDAWLRRYCNQYTRGKRCYLCTIREEEPTPQRPESERRSPGADGRELPRVTVVTDRVKANLLIRGAQKSLGLPPCELYDHLFSFIPRGRTRRCLITLIPAGDEQGSDILCDVAHVRRSTNSPARATWYFRLRRAE